MGSPNFVVLVSGRGSNFVAIDDASATVGGRARGLIASRASAPAIELALARGLPAAVIDAPKGEREELIAEQLKSWGADWIVLAGWMRILSDDFAAKMMGRVVNIHPSLLPAFPGLNPQARAISHGAKLSGATVHLVTPGDVDSGPILAQEAVPIMADDSEDSLSDRILSVEHRLYPDTLRRLFAGDFARELSRAEEICEGWLSKNEKA